jgi:ceramide glucosyltransferase
MPSALILAAALCDLLAAAGTAYFAMAIWAAKRFQKERVRAEDRDFAPPVSILKSLKGLDPNMYQAFRSH